MTRSRVLRRAVRKDCGKVSLGSKLTEHLRQYQEHPHWSYQRHYDNLMSAVKADPSLGPLYSYSTVRRYMKFTAWCAIHASRIRRIAKEIAQRELKAWLLDIILSKATPESVRNELEIENLDRIIEVARNGAMAPSKASVSHTCALKGFL